MPEISFRGLILIKLIGFITEISGISFTVTQPGYQVSAAIYDATTGRQYRTLISGKPYPIGTHTLEWDGRDRMGRIVPPGNYEWRVIQTPGFTARYVGSIGASHNVPYDYFVGNNGGPSGVVATTDRLVISATAENVPSTSCMDLANYNVLWTYGYTGHQSMVKGRIFGDRIIMLIRRTSSERQIREVSLSTGSEAFSTVLPVPGTNRVTMAATSSVAALGYGASGLIYFFNLDTRVLEPGTLTSPGGSEIIDMEYVGSVLYCLTTTGFWYRDGDEWVEHFSLSTANNPQHIAWDPSRSEWLIAEGAVDATAGHQIKRYSETGTLLNTYGRSGGRLGGAWVNTHFLSINQIAPIPDMSGGFIVSEGEDEVRRFVRLNASGAVVKELFGPLEFYNFSAPDPGANNRIIFNAGKRALGVALVDYATKDWTMVESYAIPVIANVLPPFENLYVKCWPMRKDGDLYIVSDAGNIGILKVDYDSGRLIPWAARGEYNGSSPFLLQARTDSWVEPEAPNSFIWLNQSETDEPQIADIELSSLTYTTGSHWIDDDWNVVSRGRFTSFDDANNYGWVEYPNLNPLAEFPDWGSPQNTGLVPDEIKDIPSYEMQAIRRHLGSTYLLLNANRNPHQLGDYHGAFWPSQRVGSTRIVRYNLVNEVEWVIGQGGFDRRHIPGFHNFLTNVHGFIDGCLVLGDLAANPACVYSADDGLYLGSYLDHRAEDGLPDWVYVWHRDRAGDDSDSPIPYDNKSGGSTFRRGDNVYWTQQGNQYCPLYEITGWDGWIRSQGAVSNPAIIDRTGDLGLNGLVYPSFDFTDTPVEILSHRLFFSTSAIGGSTLPDRISWTDGPAPGIPINQPFSIRWAGSLEIPLTGEWRLTLYNFPGGSTSSPGWNFSKGLARVWLGGVLVIDTSVNSSGSRQLQLAAGSFHTLEVELQHNGGSDAYFTLNWDSSELERQRIPSQWLYQDTQEGTKPVLSITRTGSVATISVSSTPVEDLDVLLSMISTELTPPNLPRIRIPAGESSAQFTLEASTGGFADVELFLNPTEGYTIDTDSDRVRLLISAESSIFPFESDEIIVFSELLDDPTKGNNVRLPHWNHVTRQSVQFLEGGGVTATNAGSGWSIKYPLPAEIDIRKNRVVFYLRGRTFGTGSGAVTIGNNDIGITMAPRTTPNPLTTVSAPGVTTGHRHTPVGPVPTDMRERQISGEALDFRVEFWLNGSVMGASASCKFAVDPDWIPVGSTDSLSHNSVPYLIASSFDEIWVRSRNAGIPTGIVDAVALSIIPYE